MKAPVSFSVHFFAVLLASLISASLVDAAAIPAQKPIQVCPLIKVSCEYIGLTYCSYSADPQECQEHGVDRVAGGCAFNLTERAASSLLTDDQDFMYYMSTTFVNGQSFSMDLDTGSSDTWARGASCTSSDGSCTGLVVSTKATRFSGNDGLIGSVYASLSQIANSVSSQTNFIDALGFTGANNVFAFYLRNTADGDFEEVTFGSVDTTKYSGTIKYVPLTSQTYWELRIGGF
ncbi:aspartic peptidase domain-containing protein [Cladochytrium replicatum]|nr:aspartic peptidase domain-containing protein [Cladochytrium replicatum]KAI8812418.1 aspartic peptidase domain-containing protein [Cladochytrium replicatum]